MPDPVSSDLFRRACGRFATGVAIATALDKSGAPQGLTINSFTSVSLDPPLILFCIDKEAQSLDAFHSAAAFAVNILAANQRELSDRFARVRGNRFSGIRWNPGDATGAPLIEDAICTIECKKESCIEAGDHFIFLGLMVDAHPGSGSPLLYFAGNYEHLDLD